MSRSDATAASPRSTTRSCDKLVLYARTLAVPVRRAADDETVLRGKLLFGEAGCDGCHTPRHETGDGAAAGALGPDDLAVHRSLAARPGRRAVGRAAELRGRGQRVAHAAAVGPRASCTRSTAIGSCCTTGARAASPRRSCGTAARARRLRMRSARCRRRIARRCCASWSRCDRPRAAALALACLLCAIAGCSDDAPRGEPAPGHARVADRSRVHADARRLRARQRTRCASKPRRSAPRRTPSRSQRRATRWNGARASWERAELLSFGPQTLPPWRLASSIDFWPARPANVDAVLQGDAAARRATARSSAWAPRPRASARSSTCCTRAGRRRRAGGVRGDARAVASTWSRSRPT